MKQNEKKRIDGFKFVRARESPDGKRKWIFDLNSEKIMTAVAIVTIIAGLMFIGFHFIQVVENSKTLVGMAAQTPDTTATISPVINVHQPGSLSIEYKYDTATKQWQYHYPDAMIYRGWYPVNNPSSTEFNNNYNTISNTLATKNQDDGLKYLQTRSTSGENIVYTGLPEVQPAVKPPVSQSGSQSLPQNTIISDAVNYVTLQDYADDMTYAAQVVDNHKLTPENIIKISDVSTAIDANPSDLMRVIQAESNFKTNDPNSRSGAIGLIQFTPSGLETLNKYRVANNEPTLTLEQIKGMDFNQQMDLSKEYLLQIKKDYGTEYTDQYSIYNAVFSPARKLGDPNEVLYSKTADGDKYTQNLEMDGKDGSTPDGVITRKEANAWLDGASSFSGQPTLPVTQPGTTPSTPTPAANPEQQKAIDEMNTKLEKLGIAKIANAGNIEALQKGLGSAEATPYRESSGNKVVSIDGKYYILNKDGSTTLVGKDDSKTTLYDIRGLGEGLTLSQDITVVNGEKTGEANTFLSQTSAEGNPISLQLRQDQFDALSKIDPTKEKVTITPSPAGTTVTVSRGSSELSSFTNSNDLKLDETGAIKAGTITTTNYNYYDKYFDKDGNQITKAEWDKLKPEERLTPKDNKNTFRSGLAKQENKEGTLYGEGKEEFLSLDKDGTQYRGELSSRVYNQKTSVNGVNYNQGDGINYVTDGRGNVMQFNCKFYTGCKFDSATDSSGKTVTDVDSISDSEFKKFAQKQLKENSQANKRMFFSEITRSMTQFSGVAGYSSLFMDSETLQAWREGVDKVFASLYLGTDYWASKICASKIETSSDNLAYVETPDGLIGVAAHIEGEKIDIQDPVNHTQRYIYKIDYFVQNHESSVVSSGFRKNDKKMKFNVEVRGPGGSREIYDQDIELATGEVKKISKDQMIVKESSNKYNKVCIVFKTPIKTIGSSFATESKDEICNKFSKYSGGPTEVEVPSSTSGGEEGAAQLAADW